MSDDVYEGEDGWLFLTGGQNRPIEMYRRSLPHAVLLVRWANIVRARAARCRRLGMRYAHVTVPEKLTVYPDKAAALGIDPSFAFGSRLRSIAGPMVVDVLRALVAGRDAGDTYLRTDSHWSSAGCRIVHDTICDALGARLRWAMEDRERLVAEDFVGDLGVKLTPPRAERLDRRFVTRDAVRVEANELVLRLEASGRIDELHRGVEVTMRNEAPDADPRRVLLFGDSYAHFAAHGLTAMLAETFREVRFVWATSIDWRHVERLAPDILLTQTAERFMMKLPRDDLYDQAAFVAARLAELGGEAA